jgi:hypothetical protein
MKLVMAVFLVSIMSCSILDAQTQIICQAGLNVANLSNPGNLAPGAVWSTRTGFVGLVAIDLPLGAHITLSPGVRFVQKGTKSQFSLDVTGTINSTLTNNYLEVPVYLKYALLNSGTRFSILLGPSFGHLLSSKAVGTVEKQGPFDVDVKQDYKPNDLSLDGGLELQTPITRTISIVGSVTYSYGLIKISEHGSDEETRDIRIMVGAAYAIN